MLNIKWWQVNSVEFTFCRSLHRKLIRKDGDYHSSRMMDGKDIQANQNMQPKKKHKKSGSSIKVKEKVEVGTVLSMHCSCLFIYSSSNESFCQHLLSAIDMDDDNPLKVQKNFICDHCYGAFRSSYHLKRHILTHTGEESQLKSLVVVVRCNGGKRTSEVCIWPFLQTGVKCFIYSRK